MVSLHTVLSRRGGTAQVVNALEAADLVGHDADSKQWRTWISDDVVGSPTSRRTKASLRKRAAAE